MKRRRALARRYGCAADPELALKIRIIDLGRDLRRQPGHGVHVKFVNDALRALNDAGNAVLFGEWGKARALLYRAKGAGNAPTSYGGTPEFRRRIDELTAEIDQLASGASGGDT